jgi:hypothetical protein
LILNIQGIFIIFNKSSYHFSDFNFPIVSIIEFIFSMIILAEFSLIILSIKSSHFSDQIFVIVSQKSDNIFLSLNNQSIFMNISSISNHSSIHISHIDSQKICIFDRSIYPLFFFNIFLKYSFNILKDSSVLYLLIASNTL